MATINFGGAAPPQQGPVPLFRQDLEVFEGPLNPDGSPSFSIFDPVRAQFFKISWPEAMIIKNLEPGITSADLAKKLGRNSTLKVMPEELDLFFQQAVQSGLTVKKKESAEVDAEYTKSKKIAWYARILKIMYLRIPLINPDRFLGKTLPIWKLLISKPAFYIYTILSFIGITLLFSRFDEFLYTFPYFFNMQGAGIYLITLTAIKIAHEFSHAYMAKYHGVRVPKMGVLVIIIMPLLYTDVTDSWKLSSRLKRLSISAAGVFMELVLAGLSTLGWVMTEPGPLHSAFFVVSSITWISTLIVNLNPGMRFDGYYLLSDLWGIDNLQSRGFAAALWKIRNWLWGLQVNPPEEGLTKGRVAGMVCYSIYSWIYRFFLYMSIGLMVYYLYTKVLAVFLFGVQLIQMVVLPLVKEVRYLLKVRPLMKINPRMIATTTVLVLIATWFFAPLPRREHFPAIVVPQQEQTVYVSSPGVIENILVDRKDSVTADQILIQIHSEEISNKLLSMNNEVNLLKTELNVLQEDEKNRSLIPEKKAELATAYEYLQGVKEQAQQNDIKAAVSGTVFFWDPYLEKGQAVSKNQVLGKVADLNSLEIASFAPERLVQKLKPGQQVTFRLKDTAEEFPGTITRISPVRAETLKYPQLASTYNRDLPVAPGRDNSLEMIESYYSIEISFNDPGTELRIGQTGEIVFWDMWSSKAKSIGRTLSKIIWREGNF